MNGHQRQ
ncbi:hypothetical protein YPPY53_1361, partial [Yersinia pestis PY-53]